MTGANMQLFHDNIANIDYLHNTIAVTLREIYNIMKECYGPYGSHVLIDNKMRPAATKDGKTILSNVHMGGSISSAVLRSITSVADKQVEEVGDGSTTTILLLCKLYESFCEIIKATNISPSTFQRYLQDVVDRLKSELKNRSMPIVSDSGEILYDKLYEVIHTSVDADTGLATKIFEMFKELNCVEPLVIIENSPTEKHSYELVKGVESTGSIINSDIFFGGFSRQTYENPRVIVINGRCDIKPDIFQDIVMDAQRNGPYIFLCTGANDALLETLIQLNNVSPGMFTVTPIFQIKETSITDEFLDLCASLGATPIDSESTKKWGTSAIALKALNGAAGSCSKALVTEFCARFTDPRADEEKIKERIADIDSKIAMLKDDPTSLNMNVLDLENRKAFLSRHYAKFFVGGASPQRKAINYELANDGIPQAISCMKHGIVPGCNVIIPQIISDILADYEGDTDVDNQFMTLILLAIDEAYKSMFIQLIVNKCGSLESANKIFDNHIKSNNNRLVPLNLRDYDTVSVLNSADTDRAILEFATDMASLLATSRAFLSLNNEFDIISKGSAVMGE